MTFFARLSPSQDHAGAAGSAAVHGASCADAAAYDPAAAAWATLADVCMSLARRCEASGWLEEDDLGSSEPFVFIGLPALALLALLADAAGVTIDWPADAAGDPAAEAGRGAGGGEGAGVEGTEAGGGGGEAAAAGHCAVALPGVVQQQQLAAQQVLSTLAQQVLGRDIGFTAAANPVRLWGALGTLQVRGGLAWRRLCGGRPAQGGRAGAPPCALCAIQIDDVCMMRMPCCRRQPASLQLALKAWPATVRHDACCWY